MRLLGWLLALALTATSAGASQTLFDFGAIGDGVADDTAAIQAGLNWVAGAHDVLIVPVGTYKVTAQLTLAQKSNFAVQGVTRQGGTYNTSWKWMGVPGGTMLLLDGVRDSEWSDFALDTPSTANEPAVMLDIDKVSPGATVSRKNAFRRMLIRGGSLATVRISNVATSNNEANIFEDVENAVIPGSVWTNGVPGGPIGYLVRNINAKNNRIVRGSISGKEAAVYAEQGSIHVQGVEIAQSNVWLRKGGGGEPIVITDCDGDSSKTFIELHASQSGPVTASGNRFVQGFIGPLLILGDTIGPLILQGNEFASGGYRSPTDSYTQMAGNGPNLVAIGNTFPNDVILPVPGLNPPKVRSLYALGNMFYAPGNAPKLANDYLISYRQSGQSVSSLQIAGSAGFRGETQSVNGPTVVLNSNLGVATLLPTAAYVLASLPSVRPGMFEGQELKLVNIGAFPVGLIDQGTLPGTGLMLVSPTLSLGSKASVTLTWTTSYGGRWLQTSPVLSPL